MKRLLSIKHALEQSRRRLIQRYTEKKMRPEALLHGLSKIMDRSFRQITQYVPLPAGSTLCAVGGYGRGELYPYSDIDILILIAQAPSASDKVLLETFVQTLWDLGLEVGSSVRTINDCLREAKNDITVETSLLEIRYLLGQQALMQDMLKAFRQMHKPKDFFLSKRIEMNQRYARYNETPYSLEPNCKESPGTLRDIQLIQWLARSNNLGTRWQDLVNADLMTAKEAAEMQAMEDNFRRFRIELHLIHNKRDDRVLFHVQPSLAEVYGYQAQAGRRASEVFMQHYYGAARIVTLITSFMLQNFQEYLFPDQSKTIKIIDEDFQSIGQRLDIRQDDVFVRKPTLLLKAFLVLQQHPELNEFTVRTQRAIWDSRLSIDAQFRAKPEHQDIFLQILKQEQGIVHTLRRMSRLRIIAMYIPAWRKITGQMQHDLFHIYTVDQHILMVVRNIRRFTMPEHAQEFPLASRLSAELNCTHLLYIAALFHDIAKGRGGDHSDLGAIDVREFAELHRLPSEDVELVVFLVENHLKMSIFAQKRDLSDPMVIKEFSQIVTTRKHLTALYILTVADIRGTSPKVWNAWKAQLLENLFHSTLQLLEGDSFDPKTILSQRKEQANAIIRLSGLTDEQRDRFWNTMDVAYFLRHEAIDIAWHTRILFPYTKTEETIVKARPIEASDSIQIVVFTKHTTNIFKKIASYFYRNQINILDARVHTSTDGYALDSFMVSSDEFGNPLAHIPTIEHGLTQALNCTVEPSNLLEPSRQILKVGANVRRSRTFPIVPTVDLQPDEYSKSWRLSITATDTPGILYNLAHIFQQHQVNLQMAKVMTLGERAEDVFIIDGDSLENPRTQLLFERDILDMLNKLTKLK